MKGFVRENLLLSLCGLNCGLCPMNNLCPGCGGGAGNQSCAIARCSLEHGGLQYCYECGEFPCEKYASIDQFDSFITHKQQMKDLKKAQEIGIGAYNAEQLEKAGILKRLLEQYNDGRKKTLYYLAVNLLELQDIKAVMERLSAREGQSADTLKERAAYAAALLEKAAAEKGVELKLKKKPRQS